MNRLEKMALILVLDAWLWYGLFKIVCLIHNHL